jgi:hypothetical protein
MNINFTKYIVFYFLEKNYFRLFNIEKFTVLMKKFGYKRKEDFNFGYQMLYQYFKKHNKKIFSIFYYNNFKNWEIRIKLTKLSFLSISNFKIYKRSHAFLNFFFKICRYNNFEQIVLYKFYDI